MKRAGQQSNRENDVHYRTGGSDKESLPLGFGKEFVRCSSHGITRILAGHLDVSAKGKCADPVIGIPVPESDQAWSESDRECFDLDLEELGDEEVSQFVNDDDDAKHEERDPDISYGPNSQS